MTSTPCPAQLTKMPRSGVGQCDGVHSAVRGQSGLGPLRELDPTRQQMVNVYFSSPTLAAVLERSQRVAMLSFVCGRPTHLHCPLMVMMMMMMMMMVP
jgi:hypothetical protein